MLSNDLGSFSGILMLPEAQHRPTPGAQELIGPPIALGIRSELLGPPFRVAFGYGPVVRTAVPEASVDEDRQFPISPPDVHSESLIRQGTEINPVPDPGGVKKLSYGHLAPGIASLLPRHVGADSLRSGGRAPGLPVGVIGFWGHQAGAPAVASDQEPNASAGREP